MSLPGAAPLEALSSGEPRETVGALVSELARLRAEAEAQRATIAELKAENRALRDEMARLKGLPPRPPPPRPSRPSGMEQATGGGGTGGARGRRSRRRRRGAKRDRDAVAAEVVVKAARRRPGRASRATRTSWCAS